jgi:hypothetical protein
MTPLHRLAAVSLLVVAGACAGQVYLPADPGGAKNDLSGLDTRQLWLESHPDTPDDIREAILEGVFIPGMTIEHRDVITNSDRRGLTGYGYWRSRDMGGETRYQWFVASEREPFDDGRGRPVCELVYRDGVLADVRYCGGQDSTDAGSDADSG